MHVVLNRKSGLGRRETEASIRDCFNHFGCAAEVNSYGDGSDLKAALQAASLAAGQVVAAGGGDGSIATAASCLMHAHKTLGVLPIGTLNHFAKDLGLPLDLQGAVQTIVQGRTVEIDVGEVNGHVFLNNSSLGLYPFVVQRREAQQARLGRGKWHAFARAAFEAFRRYPSLRVRIIANGRQIDRKTVFLFIGNNEYEFTGLGAGGRACLSAGHLGICLAKHTGRLGMLRLAVRALFGRLREARDFETYCADEVTVETRRRRLPVATDGEVTRMQTPLHYRIRRGALKVRVPAQDTPS